MPVGSRTSPTLRRLSLTELVPSCPAPVPDYWKLLAGRDRRVVPETACQAGRNRRIGRDRPGWRAGLATLRLYSATARRPAAASLSAPPAPSSRGSLSPPTFAVGYERLREPSGIAPTAFSKDRV